MKKNNLSFIAILLVLAGELLIIFSFFTLIPETARTRVFYLDMGVVTLMYLAAIGRFFVLYGNRKDFDAKIGGLGVFWVFVSTYILFATAGIILGANLILTFKIQLLYQIIFFFGFLVGLFIAYSSARHAVSIAEAEQNVKSGVYELSETLMSIVIALNAYDPEWKEEEALISKVKEKIRFLTASSNSNAKELEFHIANEANQVLDSLRSSNPDHQFIISKLKICDNLLNKRKQFYIN